MPSFRVTLRDAVKTLCESLTGFDASKVVLGKRDKVEGLPLAGVYLDELESERSAMRGRRFRSQSVGVSLYVHDSAGDAESELSDLVDELELAVETARQAGTFGAIRGVEMVTVEFSHDPNSKGCDADAHLSFLFEFEEVLTP